MTLRRKLFVIAVVYVVEGFPMGVVTGLWPYFLRELNVSLTEIGFVSGLSLIWTLKMFWSPLVDRFGQRRHWIAAAQLVMAAGLLSLVGFEQSKLLGWVWVALGTYCAASATQDIAIDAYTIGLVEAGDEGPANAMRMTGYRIGMVGLANGLFFLPRFIEWSGTWMVAAVLQAAMAIGVLSMPRVEVAPETRREMWASLRRWLSRNGAWGVFAFVLLYRIGDSAMGAMVTTFWNDQGLTEEEVGLVSGIGGGIVVIVGAWIAGSIVARFGIGRALLWIGLLALLSNVGYAAVAAYAEGSRPAIYTASLIESFCAGMAGVAFMSFLMRICEKEHAAVQYALLTGVYNLAGSLLKIPSGAITEAIGYAGYFALTAAFAAPAFAFLPAARRWLTDET